jgi:hypothetical protein
LYVVKGEEGGLRGGERRQEDARVVLFSGRWSQLDRREEGSRGRTRSLRDGEERIQEVLKEGEKDSDEVSAYLLQFKYLISNNKPVSSILLFLP